MNVRNHALTCSGRNVRPVGYRPAFALIELMVAIIILGMGMVMVATMFPIAWGRARKLSETTTQISITNAAETTIRLLTRVDGPDGNAGSFAGDLIFDETWAAGTSPGRIVALSDTRVHLLHMENLLVSPRRFVPDRTHPWHDDDATTHLIERRAPWQLEKKPLLPSNPAMPALGIDDAAVICGMSRTVNTPGYCDVTFLSPQVRFEQRVYPPMQTRNNVDDAGEFIGPDDPWDASLSTRRYAWAVFHRTPAPLFPNVIAVGPDGTVDDGVVGPVEFRLYGSADEAENLAAAEVGSYRSLDFQVYYVMLRRPQPTLRYARQDPSTAPDPYVLTGSADVVPGALPPTSDVMLPEPWRVQIWVHSPWPPKTQANASGVPTEVQVPPDLAHGTEPAILAMLAQMFQRGTWFIDEITGQIYRVVEYRLAGDGSKAFLTLDREMTLEAIDLVGIDAGHPLCPDNCYSGAADPEERLRTVWVFPPPVQAARSDDDIPIFDGPHPVVGIEVRDLSQW